MDTDSQETLKPSLKDYLTMYNTLNKNIRDALNEALEKKDFYYCNRCDSLLTNDCSNRCCTRHLIHKDLIYYTAGTPFKGQPVKINMLSLLQYMVKDQND